MNKREIIKHCIDMHLEGTDETCDYPTAAYAQDLLHVPAVSWAALPDDAQYQPDQVDDPFDFRQFNEATTPLTPGIFFQGSRLWVIGTADYMGRDTLVHFQFTKE